MIKVNRVRSIKNNLIIYSLSIIALMTIQSTYSLMLMDNYKAQIEVMFEKHIYLSEIEEIMDVLDESLLGYLSSKRSTKLNTFMINSEKLKELVDYSSVHVYNTEDLMMKNITNLTETYISHANDAIAYKRQRNVVRYYEYYEKSIQTKQFILRYIDKLNNKQLNQNSKHYIEFVNVMHLLQKITYGIVFGLIGISLVIVYYITSRMVKPVSKLANAAEEIAKGNFNTDDVVVEFIDEFMLLAATFNKMKNSISQYVEEIKLNAETEAKLKDEQMKNIKMEHLLDNAKLCALQSQINPHFLFNTINAAVQLSIMERASRTGQFLESMSRLFRYNIQKMDSSCTLAEEIKNIKDYYDLLKVRFGDLIKFEFSIDPSTLDVKVPPLTLQPLVENAYIHGLSGLEEGGSIFVKTIRTMDSIKIIVQDTGKGMENEIIHRILNTGQEDPQETEGGIGVSNVRDRLELFYHKKEILSIESKLGYGVKITIMIPHDRE